MSRYTQELLKPYEFGADRKTLCFVVFLPDHSLAPCLLHSVGSRVAEFRTAAVAMFLSSSVPLLIVSC